MGEDSLGSINLVLGIYASIVATGAAIAAGFQTYLQYRTQKVELEFHVFVGVVAGLGPLIKDQICWSVTNRGLRNARLTNLAGRILDRNRKEAYVVLPWEGIPTTLEPGDVLTKYFGITSELVGIEILDLHAIDSTGRTHHLNKRARRTLNVALGEFSCKAKSGAEEIDKSRT